MGKVTEEVGFEDNADGFVGRFFVDGIEEELEQFVVLLHVVGALDVFEVGGVGFAAVRDVIPDENGEHSHLFTFADVRDGAATGSVRPCRPTVLGAAVEVDVAGVHIAIESAAFETVPEREMIVGVFRDAAQSEVIGPAWERTVGVFDTDTDVARRTAVFGEAQSGASSAQAGEFED